MTAVLGLVGSARPWGNSEVLAREALAGAAEAGADALKLLRLTDLRLEPCTGCMVCALAGRVCPLDDDLNFLLDEVRQSDALIIAAPTYFTGPTAQVKSILDRFLILSSSEQWAQMPAKPAMTTTAAGLESWRGVTVPLHNALAQGLGGRLVGWMVCYATGPGEVLLQPDALAHARDLGRRLVTGEPAAPPENVCPVCGADFFHMEGTRMTCPICGQTGTLQAEGKTVAMRFDAPRSGGRWTPASLHKHMEEWVIPSGARFMARRQEIKGARARYDSLNVEWVRPS